ncbi:MAG TPA: TolC family protein [Bacteroidia bacterium]|nr:TolC family protein [Bacteroidia bacterium]
MIKNRSLIFVYLFLLTAYHAGAQTTLPLSLQDAIAKGTEASKSMKASDARVQIAKAKYSEAIDGALPSVKLSAGYTRLSDIEQPKIKFPGTSEAVTLFPVYTNNYLAKLSVSETVFSGFRLKYAMESQRLLQKAAEYDSEKDKDEVVFGIVSAYFNLYKLKVSGQLINDNLNQVKEHVRETSVWEKEGIATHNDVLRWQLQQSNIELTKMDIENNQAIAEYNFNLMLGINSDTHVEVDTTEVEKLVPALTLNECFGKAMEKRGDLMAMDMRSKAASNALKVAKNSYLPQLAVAGNYYDARPNSRVIPPQDEFRTSWDVGLNFTWDLVSLYSNKHVVSEANGLYRQTDESKNALSDAVKMEVNQNYLLYVQSKSKVDVMRKAVEQADENNRLMDSRYRNNLVTLSDLLDANTTLLQSKINLALAKADVQLAYYRLQKAIGTIQ